VTDSIPVCGDFDSTLVTQNADEWQNAPFILDMLDREGMPPAEVPPCLAPPEAKEIVLLESWGQQNHTGLRL